MNRERRVRLELAIARLVGAACRLDERGGVESVILTEPLERTYDSLVLAATKTWTYQPALRNGTPVKYRKRIQVTLPRQTN